MISVCHFSLCIYLAWNILDFLISTQAFVAYCCVCVCVCETVVWYIYIYIILFFKSSSEDSVVCGLIWLKQAIVVWWCFCSFYSLDMFSFLMWPHALRLWAGGVKTKPTQRERTEKRYRDKTLSRTIIDRRTVVKAIRKTIVATVLQSFPMSYCCWCTDCPWRFTMECVLPGIYDISSGNLLD